MKEFQFTVKDPVGIHARPAGLIVKKAKEYQSTITVVHGDKSAKMTALMKLMGLGIKCNDTITIQVEGDDEEKCAAEIEKYLEETLAG
jgi:phosphocarrier protein